MKYRNLHDFDKSNTYWKVSCKCQCLYVSDTVRYLSRPFVIGFDTAISGLFAEEDPSYRVPTAIDGAP